MAVFKKVVFLVIIYAVINHCSAFKVTENDMTDDEIIERAVEKIMSPDHDKANDDKLTVEKRTVSAGECNDQLKFPESPTIVTVNNNRVIDGTHASAVSYCSPKSFPVPITAPGHWTIFPTAVNLKRCYGATYSSLTECVASKKEKVRVKYIKAGSGQYEYADMWEHTECNGFQCKIRPEHCNANQTYSPEQCDCICPLPSNTTCQGDRIFKQDKCECQCRIPRLCGLYQEWDPKSCSCKCAKCIEDMCTKHNKIIDAKTCHCK